MIMMILVMIVLRVMTLIMKLLTGDDDVGVVGDDVLVMKVFVKMILVVTW